MLPFSGDKLLGGPQAGIIVGKKEYIEQMKRNPLTRAFRVDKFTIAALEVTLRYYLDESIATKEIPTFKYAYYALGRNKQEGIKAEKGEINRKVMDNSLIVDIEESFSEVGGGSLPLEKLPSKSIAISLKDLSTQEFENNLREFNIPIITRLYKDKIHLDLRTINEDEFNIVVEGLEYALKESEGV